ncbi:MAG: HD-GYP domain-containing protein [Candidatus Aminicenantes bacterium]
MKRTKTWTIQDERGQKIDTRYDFYRNPLSPADRKASNRIMGMKSFVLPPREYENGSSRLLSWSMEAEKREKVKAAKRILRDLSRYNTHIFQDHQKDKDDCVPEKHIFLNSNLFYWVAATDGNEDTLGHSQLVARYTLMLSRALGIEDKNDLLHIERGALLHDIGKIGIPESILRKAGPLSAAEKEVVKEHPLIGYEMIEEFEFLKKAAQVVLFHHESYDGTGYPFGLAGEEIPLEARIFALADTLDAITSDRPYRQASGFEEASREIEKWSGSQFDPDVVEGFFSVPIEKWKQIKGETESLLGFSTVH